MKDGKRIKQRRVLILSMGAFAALLIAFGLLLKFPESTIYLWIAVALFGAAFYAWHKAVTYAGGIDDKRDKQKALIGDSLQTLIRELKEFRKEIKE